MLAHCGWDLVLYLSVPELREPALIAHHVVTGALGYLALWPVAFGHYYDIFYAGVAELSNVPLAFMELCKLLPELQSRHDRLSKASRAMFSLSFAVLRLGYWPLLTLQFWRDVLDAIDAGRVHSLPIAYFYLGCNALLTGMQILWGWKLLRGWLKALQSRVSTAW
eukprot:2397601-Prymnesium_polylepis.1